MVHIFGSSLLLTHWGQPMLSGNDHGEDAYGILEPDVQTIILDGMQNGSLRFLYPDNMCHKRNLHDLVHHNSVLFMIY